MKKLAKTIVVRGRTIEARQRKTASSKETRRVAVRMNDHSDLPSSVKILLIGGPPETTAPKKQGRHTILKNKQIRAKQIASTSRSARTASLFPEIATRNQEILTKNQERRSDAIVVETSTGIEVIASAEIQTRGVRIPMESRKSVASATMMISRMMIENMMTGSRMIESMMTENQMIESIIGRIGSTIAMMTFYQERIERREVATLMIFQRGSMRGRMVAADLRMMTAPETVT
jgi:hypothetical protein